MANSANKRVACLYRVSTKKQVEENDIPMQKNACKDFIAGMKGWNLTKEYLEKGVSGYHKSAEQRDILQQVKKDAEKSAFDILLVFMFDRLGRREDETPFIVEWFVEQEIEVWSVKEGQQRFDNRVDKLLNYIRFWQSGGESEKTSIRVKEKHKQMVEEGKFRGGAAPFGYKLIDSENRNQKGYKLKKLVINENESEIVRMIFNLAAEHGYGGYRIARYLNEKKVVTKHTNLWTAGTVMSLLKNPIYKGHYVSGKRQSSRGVKKRVSPEQWIYSKAVMPELIIVHENTWNKAEEIRIARKENSGKYPKQTKGPLLLVGLVKCGCCGATMASRYALKKWTRKKDNEEIRYYQPKYICQRRSAKISCTGRRTYSRNKIDLVVLEIIYGYLDCLGVINLSGEVNATQRGVIKNNESKLLEIRENIAKEEHETDILNNEIVKCLAGKSNFTSERLSKIIEKKEAEIEKLRISESEIEEKLATNLKEANFAERHSMIPDWASEFQQAPLAIQKMLLAKLIEDIYIREDSIKVNFRFSLFDFKYSQIISKQQ